MGSELQDILIDPQAHILTQLFLNFLYKFQMLFKWVGPEQFPETSSFIAGKTINMIFNIIDFSEVSNEAVKLVSKRIHEGIIQHNKNIVFFNNYINKNPNTENICLQNKKISKPLGTIKLMMLETLVIYSEQLQKLGVPLDMNDEYILNIFISWAFTHITNSVYVNMFFRYLKALGKENSSNYVKIYLFKLNTLDQIVKVHEKINNFVELMQVEPKARLKYSFLVGEVKYFIGSFLKIITQNLKNSKTGREMEMHLMRSMNWNTLKDVYMVDDGEQ